MACVADWRAGEVLGTRTPCSVSEGACVRQAITTAMQTVDENAFPARSRVKQRFSFAYQLNAGKSFCQIPWTQQSCIGERTAVSFNLYGRLFGTTQGVAAKQ